MSLTDEEQKELAELDSESGARQAYRKSIEDMASLLADMQDAMTASCEKLEAAMQEANEKLDQEEVRAKLATS